MRNRSIIRAGLCSLRGARTLRKRLGAFAPVIAGLLFSFPVLGAHPYQEWADEFGLDMSVSYDAKRVMESRGERFEATERRAPQKMYTEVNVEGMSAGIILREDLNKSFMLMPSMGMYREESLEGGMMQSANGLEFSRIEKVGSESVEGFSSTKYKVRFEDNEGKGAGFVWVTDSGVPIQMDMIYSSRSLKGERIKMYLTDLKLREQDAKWFEVPDGLQPMTLGSIGAMFGGQMANNDAAGDAQADEDDEKAAARKACLAKASEQAREAQEKAEKKRGLGRLMGAVTRTARRFGLDDIAQITRDVNDANATAEDMSVIADELGISESQVKECYDQ